MIRRCLAAAALTLLLAGCRWPPHLVQPQCLRAPCPPIWLAR